MLTDIPRGLEHVMNIDPEILGGEPCFNGTRVPLETVTDNLAGGHSPDEILESYPSLSLEHVRAVLQWQWDLVHEATGASSRAS
jgi:uncharacterized protein (DUF433 family)